MNLSDIKQINVTNVEVNGKAIVGATVENVYALDSLQAEYRAEKAVAALAAANDQVVSADQWEVVKAGDGKAETWTIKFSAS